MKFPIVEISGAAPPSSSPAASPPRGHLMSLPADAPAGLPVEAPGVTEAPSAPSKPHPPPRPQRKLGEERGGSGGAGDPFTCKWENWAPGGAFPPHFYFQKARCGLALLRALEAAARCQD